MAKAAMALLLVAALALAACGGSSRSSSSSKKTGEAQSAAAGDIPDNQVFLTFRNSAAGYSMKYPEGWAQQGAGKQVTFRDKNNIVRVVIARGSAPSAATVRAEVARLKGATLKSGPDSMTLAGRPGFKVAY